MNGDNNMQFDDIVNRLMADNPGIDRDAAYHRAAIDYPVQFRDYMIQRKQERGE